MWPLYPGFDDQYKLVRIGLFKMFLRWILAIFNIQIQRERGHKLM